MDLEVFEGHSFSLYIILNWIYTVQLPLFQYIF